MENRDEAPTTTNTLATAENLNNPEDQSINFNRIALTSNFKNQICSQISDSTDSLPIWGLDNRYAAHRASNASNSSIDSTTNGKANLQDTSAEKTPMPKDLDPLAEAGGATASRTSTRQLSSVDSRKTVTIDDEKRPSTLRRLTTKIKRTISQGQGKTHSN
jgi:hypothetical protein